MNTKIKWNCSIIIYSSHFLNAIFFIGLDPVGPGYYIFNTHLSASDAEFVDVIHTDMGVYGLALKIGHVDFFPNYGYRPQPGCPISENGLW